MSDSLIRNFEKSRKKRQNSARCMRLRKSCRVLCDHPTHPHHPSLPPLPPSLLPTYLPRQIRIMRPLLRTRRHELTPILGIGAHGRHHHLRLFRDRVEGGSIIRIGKQGIDVLCFRQAFFAAQVAFDRLELVLVAAGDCPVEGGGGSAVGAEVVLDDELACAKEGEGERREGRDERGARYRLSCRYQLLLPAASALLLYCRPPFPESCHALLAPPSPWNKGLYHHYCPLPPLHCTHPRTYR